MNLTSFQIFIVMTAVNLCLSLLHRTYEETEYCMLESFQPRCLKNEVIVVKSATYGRMRIGRCITAEEVVALGPLVGDDPRIVGCSVDVLAVLDRKCSGKANCDIRVGDISNENVKPCVPGLTVYLEVSYECVSTADEGRSCAVLVTSNPVHIISSASSERRCGIKFQPWPVDAPSGQKILVTLLEFSSSNSREHEEQEKHPCVNRGIIVDKDGRTNTSICVNGQQREKQLFQSVGHSVQIFFSLAGGQEDDDRKFILRLTTVGCSDIIPPEDTWLKRNDNTIIIGCYASRQTWHLSCEEGSWIGVFGNCSKELEGNDLIAESEFVAETWNDGQVLAVVAISGVTVVICLTILCVGIVCLRRFSSQSKNMNLPASRTFNRHVNLSSSQYEEQRIPLGIAANIRDDEIRDSFTSQLPTYSIFVADNNFGDVNYSADQTERDDISVRK